MKEGRTNWEKIGVIVAIITLVVGFFGWTAADCMGCSICGSGSSGGGTKTTTTTASTTEYIPTESEIQAELEQKTGKREIKNVKILSAGSDSYHFKHSFSDSAISNTGTQYASNLILYSWQYKNEKSYVEFYLNSELKDFICTVALSDETRDMECKLNVAILVDNKVAWSKDYKSGTLPEKINIDVTNATVLKIIVSCISGPNDDGEIIFGDAYFTLAE